jgi:sulfane dehydrogenase subunit SoxC
MDGITLDELQLAARNHGMPLEALRYPITPVGLHYLLIHFDIPAADPATWRLEVGGRLGRPLSLTLDDLTSRPSVSLPVTLECAGNGRALLEPRPVSQPWVVEAVGTATWTGTPLAPILREAGVADDAVEVLFTGLDRGVEGGVEQEYQRSLPVQEALREEVLLAWAVNGQPLPPQHGFPLRLVVPGWYGMTHVKWLRSIEVVAEPFQGYQHVRAYRIMSSPEDPGSPVTRMLPRALIEPPGIPEFLPRVRHVRPGPCTVRGRGWSGWGPVERVDVSTDGGLSWSAAALGDAPSPYAWRAWSFGWDATPGEHVLAARATDSTGREQPAEEPWNVKGYSNNAPHRIPVVVR